MPVLSLYYGLSSVSALYLKEDGTYTTDSFGYTYNGQLYSHFYSEENFYHDVLNYFLKNFEADFTNISVIATGFFQPKTIGSDYHVFVHLEDLFYKYNNYNIFYADFNSIFAQNTFMSLCNLNMGGKGDKERDLQANLSLYSNIRPTNLTEYNLMLMRIWNMVESLKINVKNIVYDMAKPVLFFGEIFKTEDRKFRDLSYLYVMNLLKNSGVYPLLVDGSCDLIHLMNLADFNKDYLPYLAKYEPNTLGVLLNCPGETSFLIETEVGTQQLVELQGGKLFPVPLDKASNARVVIKNAELGCIEKNVSGGELGLILDTRHKNNSDYTQTNLEMDMEMNLKVLNEVTERI